MKYSKQNKLSIKHILIIAVCVFATMLFTCAFTSPLYPYYNNSDSAIFTLIGRAMCEGKTCYVDIFDHKGPIMFFIEALGWKIGGRTGIWVIECIATLISVFAIEAICRQLKAKAALPIIASAAVLFYTFGHGNLTEDYSLPLIYISLYLAVKYFVSGSERHPLRYAFIYGISFGMMAFIRINNALIVCALILCIAIDLIAKKQWKNVVANILAGIAGIAVVAIPVCVYFYFKHALYDMLYATFLYNLLYAEGSSHAAILTSRLPLFIALYAPVLFALVVFTLKRYTLPKALRLTMITAAALSFLMLLYANVYEHYFTLAIPAFTVAVAVAVPDVEIKKVFRFRKTGKSIVAVVLSVIIVCYLGMSAYRAAAPMYKEYITDISYDRYHQMSQAADIIPQDEKDSVIGFNIPPEWYMDCDIVPCYKYYIMQYWWTTSTLDVYGEFMGYVKTEHPMWLITGTDMNDETLLNIIDEDYELQEENDYACFYRYMGEEI